MKNKGQQQIKKNENEYIVKDDITKVLYVIPLSQLGFAPLINITKSINNDNSDEE